MGQALYRKYRSQKLSEIVGQEHITRTLENALKSGQISHAYLFTGPKGVGKTSIARIMAYEVNGLPYDPSGSHLDIIEIDAASNRRIDEIRELRQRANLAPTSAKYKVYIIDEVHMLTKEAFNALLKTLEEPPDHVIFILATTEAHKVPETITSRTQQFKFRPIPINQVVSQLKKIAKSEKITIDDEALAMIAEDGNGSFRDSIGLLDQVSSTGSKIAKADVEQQLGMAPETIINNLLNAVNKGNLKELQSLFVEVHSSGYSYAILSKQLVEKLRQDLLNKQGNMNGSEALDLMESLINVPTFQDQTSAFEIALLALAVKKTDSHPLAPIDPIPEEPVANSVPKRPEKSQPIKIADVIDPEPEPSLITEPNKDPIAYDEKTWVSLLDVIKNQYNTLYSVAKMTEPELSKTGLLIKTRYPFHQRKLSEDKTKRLFEDIIFDLTGKRVKIEVVVDKNVGLDAPTQNQIDPEPISMDNISNIFGNAEVVE